MRVEPLTATREADWTTFLRACSDGLAYHSLPYRDLLTRHLGCYPEYLIAVDEGDRVRGLLPAMWSGPGPEGILNSLPFYGSIGGIVSSDARATDALARAWAERASRPTTLAATAVTSPLEHGPDMTHNRTDSRIGQLTPLPAAESAEAALLDQIDPSARRNVRKALRLGTTVTREPSSMQALAAIHQANMRQIGGRAKPSSFFQAVSGCMRSGDEYDVYVAHLDGKIVAALLVLWFGEVAEYFTPAVVLEHRSDQPLAAILLRAMTDAAERGMRWWNWGGTWHSQEGVYRFKKKWGARDHPYDYWIQLNDQSLLSESPDSLRERFGDFYVVPFSQLPTEVTST